MKTKSKSIWTVSAATLLIICTAFVYAQDPWEDDAKPGLNRRIRELSEEQIDQVMQQLTETNPQMAERLDKLRDENPDAFQMQIRRIAMRNRVRERAEDGQGMRAPRGDRYGKRLAERTKTRRDRPGIQRLQQKENEILEWLEKNDPNQAQELKELQQENRRLYIRKIASTVRKYGEVIEAEKTNPALAAVLKEDVEVKSRIYDLLKEIKIADEDQQQQLKETLETLVSRRFDLIVKKKQLQYEELQKKLEELKNQIKQSQAELDNLQEKKAEHIEQRIEELVNRTEKIRWD